MRRKCVCWIGCGPVIFGAAGVSLGATSSNWSGYTASPSSGQSFTDVSADWVVPTVHPPSSGTDYSLDWVGLDGVSDTTVEQCGTTGFVTSSGTTEYFPWYEFAPASLIQITSFNVNPGDKIFAEVTYEASQSSTGNYVYNFTVTDQTTGNSFNMPESTSTSDNRSSAEWIAEAPSVGGSISTLANFGSVTFSNAMAAQTGGSDQAISGFSDTNYTMIQGGKTAAFASPLNYNGEAFNVTYGPGPASFTWNNSGAASPGDGLTWDVGYNNNWNSGTNATFYSDGSKVTFNDSNNGHYAVTLNSAVSPASVTVSNSSGNYSISGSGSIGGTASLTKSGSRTLTLSTANTYTGGTNVSAGTLIIEPTSSTTSALPKGVLSITGGEVQLASDVTLGSQSANTPVTAPTSNVNITSLSITGGGVLDITDNHIIIDYSGTDPISSIAAMISSGFTGTWTGTGITSSTARVNAASYGIGYADAADKGNPAGLHAGQIEVMYTLLGDANLDGKVNGTDFNLMATNFNQSVTAGWDKGDFNYDGKVNGSDFVLLSDNFNDLASQSAVSSADVQTLDSFAAANDISLASVPEPASAALMAAAGLGLLRRRRKSPRPFFGA